MDSYNQKFTCLLGDPVDHSVSDIMFQSFAQITGLENYQHLKLRVPNTDKKNLETAIRALAVFGIIGANITLPYKEIVMQYLNSIDGTAKQMGAVNTIVNKNGQLMGYNTDELGAIQAIETKLRPIKKSDQVMIFGAGGAARAIIAGIANKARQIIILNRKADLNRAIKLKNDFACLKIPIEIRDLSNENIINTLSNSDIIINATSVGMYPNHNNSLIKKQQIESVANFNKNFADKIFFDVVFNPFITDFLKLAQEYGCKICPGIYMMIYQGIEAFNLWTGKKVPAKEIENICKLLYNTIQSIYEK